MLDHLLSLIDLKAADHSRLVRYYTGTQPLTYLSPDARKNLDNRLSTVSVNIPRLLVDTLGERLRVVGFTDPAVWPHWTRNGMQTLSATCHREAMMLGDCYVLVWADHRGPRITVESATQIAVAHDPATREVTAGVKRWEDRTGTWAVEYGPEEIVKHHSPTRGATTGFRVVERLANPFGRPPLVHFRNGDRLVVDGISEMLDVIPLTDALVKVTTDMLVASEFTARPRRWATGIELVEDDNGDTINPIPEGDRAMISEDPESRFGQLPGSDLSGYETAVGVLMRQISAVSGLPEHALGITGENPASADAIRASEAALTAKAEARQGQFGQAWTEVAQLVLAADTGRDPDSFDPVPVWADASTRSVAAEADAAVKLVQAGILPVTHALKRLGYSETEIAEIRTARRAEALDTIGTNLDQLLTRGGAR